MSRTRIALTGAGQKLLVGVVGAFAWILGLKTWFDEDASCTWVQRNASLLFLACVLASVVVYFLILRRSPNHARIAAFRAVFVAGLMLVPWLLGVTLSGPSLFGAINRGRQKRTIVDMRAWAQLLSAYQEQHGAYPEANSIHELSALLGPTVPPEIDAWNNLLVAVSSPSGYTITSCGQCGQLDHQAQERPLWDASVDIVLKDGRFVQHPEGLNVE